MAKMSMKMAMKKFEGSKEDMAMDKKGAKKLMSKGAPKMAPKGKKPMPAFMKKGMK